MKTIHALIIIAIVSVIAIFGRSVAETPLPPGMRRASDPAPAVTRPVLAPVRERIEKANSADSNVLAAVRLLAKADDIVLNRRALFLTDEEAVEARRLVDCAHAHRCVAIEELNSNQP